MQVPCPNGIQVRRATRYVIHVSQIFLRKTVVAELSENVYQQTMAGEVMAVITTNRHKRRGAE